MTRLKVISPEGLEGTLSEEVFANASQAGWKLTKEQLAENAKQEAEGAKRREAGEQTIRAGAEAVARGASFGLSDVLATETGYATPEELQLRKEENPVVVGAGELGGAILPALIPGGQFTAAGAVARLGTRVAARLAPEGASLAARLAAQAVASGLETSLWGAGNEIGEATREGRQITAQKVLASAGLAGLTGAAGGAVGELAVKSAGAAVRGINARIKAIAENSLDPTTGKTVLTRGLDVLDAIGYPVKKEGWFYKDLDLTKGQVDKLRKEKVFDIASDEMLSDPRYATTAKSEYVDLVKTKKEEAGKAIGDSMKTFDELTASNPDYRPDFKSVADEIYSKVSAPLLEGGVLNKPVIARVKEIAQDLEATGGGSFAQAETRKQAFDRNIRWDSAEPGPVQDALRKIRTILNNEIESKASEISKTFGSPELFDAWKAGKRTYRAMAALEEPLANRAIAATTGNQVFGLGGIIASAAGAGAALASGNPAAIAATVLLPLARKWGSDNLPKIFALRLKALRATSGARKAGEALSRKVDEIAAQAANMRVYPEASVGVGSVAQAPVLGKYADVLKMASSRGPMALMALHSLLAEDDPEYRETLQNAGMNFNASPDQTERINTLATLDAKGREFDKKINSSIDSFLKGKKTKKPESRPLDSKTLATTYMNLAVSPETIRDRLTTRLSAIAGNAPETTAEIMAAANRAVTFLSEKAPKHSSALNEFPALKRNWQPSGADLHRFRQYVDAVEAPGVVIENLSHGTASKDAVDALRAVYPELYEDIKDKILTKLAETGTALDYRKRLHLNNMLGAPSDDTLNPQVIASIQQTFAGPQPQETRRAPSGGKVSPGASKLVAGSATETERLAARRA